jgi:hypothetical protein
MEENIAKNHQILKAVDMREELFRKSLAKARLLGISWSDYVNMVLEAYLKEQGENISKRPV